MLWHIEKFWMALRLGRGVTRRVESTLHWLSGIAIERDQILVDFPGYRRCFYCNPAEYLTARAVRMNAASSPAMIEGYGLPQNLPCCVSLHYS